MAPPVIFDPGFAGRVNGTDTFLLCPAARAEVLTTGAVALELHPSVPLPPLVLTPTLNPDPVLAEPLLVTLTVAV